MYASQLLTHAEVVPNHPMLGYLTLGNAEPMHMLNSVMLARRQEACELSLVRAAVSAAYRYHISIRDDALDVEAGVGERGHKPMQCVLGSSNPPRMFGRCRMVEIVGCHNLLDAALVMLVPDLFYKPTDDGLVLFF